MMIVSLLGIYSISYQSGFTVTYFDSSVVDNSFKAEIRSHYSNSVKYNYWNFDDHPNLSQNAEYFPVKENGKFTLVDKRLRKVKTYFRGGLPEDPSSVVVTGDRAYFITEYPYTMGGSLSNLYYLLRNDPTTVWQINPHHNSVFNLGNVVDVGIPICSISDDLTLFVRWIQNKVLDDEYNAPQNIQFRLCTNDGSLVKIWNPINDMIYHDIYWKIVNDNNIWNIERHETGKFHIINSITSNKDHLLITLDDNKIAISDGKKKYLWQSYRKNLANRAWKFEFLNTNHSNNDM